MSSAQGFRTPNTDVLDPEQVFERVLSCVRKLLPRARARETILASARLRWELGLDSMQLLELVFLLEEEFSWHALDSDFASKPIETVADVVDVIVRVLSDPGRRTEGGSVPPG